MTDEKKPFVKLSVEAGKSYFICTCKKSAKFPLCDGSHSDTEMRPHKITADANKDITVCGCGSTGNAPYCDGSHKNK